MHVVRNKYEKRFNRGRPLSADSIVRERQNQNDLNRYKDIIKTRPSTVAAKEFFSDFKGDWLSLPQRCERLVKALDAWVSSGLNISYV